MFGYYVSRAISTLIGTLYPAYSSYKAIKSKDREEYKRWMQYWTVFSFFTALEAVMDIFVFWLPLYYEAKIAFVICLLIPRLKVTEYVFRHILHPTLSAHEDHIDETMELVKSNAMNHVTTAWNTARSSITATVMSSLNPTKEAQAETEASDGEKVPDDDQHSMSDRSDSSGSGFVHIEATTQISDMRQRTAQTQQQ